MVGRGAFWHRPSVSRVETPHPALAGFHAPVAEWFAASFEAPTRAQELGWPVLREGRSALVLAPTGSGKTLAAFLSAIDRLLFEPAPAKTERCRVLYVSPLKALAVDVDRNLRAPLVGITRWAERRGVAVTPITTAIRTGDTPARERAALVRAPADILITTPESLYLVLTSEARSMLRSVRTVIVDEVHAVAGTKRGAHLALSLERLEQETGAALQRIGLSATVRPVAEVARFLGGHGEGGAPRTVEIVDAGRSKPLDLTITVPVEDMARIGEVVEIPSGPAAQGEARTSIWPAMHPVILDLIRAHQSTLVFVNSRRLAERLAGALNELAGEDLVRAHHGSLAREQRLTIEDELKAGRLRSMVATSSLELGIDMGAIDLVIQVESPPSVASAIQRIGRAGHRIDVASKGVILPKFRGDLLASAALAERMLEGRVEPLRMPRNPLDVLAQQVVAMVAMDDWSVDDLERLVRRAAPFAQLPRSMLEAVLDMLSGRYPSDEFAELRPRLTWDRVNGTLHARQGARRVAVTSGGTIPDRGLYGVFLVGAAPGTGRVGELDEEMVFETRVGETFLLGASTWRVEEITHDRVLVSPAPGVPGKMPFWRGEAPGRPLEFGRAIGALTRELLAGSPEQAQERLTSRHALDERAARNLLEYLRDQAEATSAVPDDRTIVVERTLDEMGDWRVCVLSPFGSKVHAPWALAIAAVLRQDAERSERAVDVMWTDDGIVVRYPDADDPPPTELLLVEPERAEELVLQQLAGGTAYGLNQNALFATRFREAAARALLLPRRFPGRRSPLWQQRLRASELLAATARFGSFPIVLEAYRECLQDVFDMPALAELLREIRSRRVRVVTVDTRSPSPFAAALMFNYVANFIYEGDAPLAERRAQALAVDPAQLRELLGDVELRELIDRDALDDLERQLQHLTPERAPRHADGLHDLLLRVGDLSDGEVGQRTGEGATEWLEELARHRRAVRLRIAGEERWVAAEDVGRFRDAVGIPPPPGMPQALLEPVDDPVGDLVARWARTHGPFVAGEPAARWDVPVETIAAVLHRLEQSGRVVQGEFRPGGAGIEWCDAGVLRTLRQRSLAKLRREVEPAPGAALARLLLSWHGIDAPRRAAAALLDAIEQLEGAALPASDLERLVLPARLASYDPAELDRLTGSGQVVWVGAGALGPHDGRVRLCLAEHASALLGGGGDGERPSGRLHDAVREHLAARGASFFPQIHAAVGAGFVPELVTALWDLVWAGEVTNDTLHPLRALVAPVRRRRTGPTVRRSPRDLPPEAAGRWSLVSSLAGAPSGPTERLTGQARALLERHGVLTREAVHAEGIEGGFSAVYRVLKAMEEAGRVRRGYFVAGLGATQFALPGAVDRLRQHREPPEAARAVLLAATDPASPYGAALPWPERTDGRRPARAAGAVVVLVDGVLAAWMGRGERQLLTFLSAVEHRAPADTALEVARALAREVESGRRRTLFVEDVDGGPPERSPLAAALGAAGFVLTPHGYLRK